MKNLHKSVPMLAVEKSVLKSLKLMRGQRIEPITQRFSLSWSLTSPWFLCLLHIPQNMTHNQHFTPCPEHTLQNLVFWPQSWFPVKNWSSRLELALWQQIWNAASLHTVHAGRHGSTALSTGLGKRHGTTHKPGSSQPLSWDQLGATENSAAVNHFPWCPLVSQDWATKRPPLSPDLYRKSPWPPELEAERLAQWRDYW